MGDRTFVLVTLQLVAVLITFVNLQKAPRTVWVELPDQVWGFGRPDSEGAVENLRGAHSLCVDFHSVWMLEVGTTGHPIEGAG